uniref:Uncharacterized protein n=1 Tax=Brassica oleracea TaxID=3712 RepID=A0A3P6B6Q6_BRAOL|nr:unnamed protein product [Brassica oleracea]
MSLTPLPALTGDVVVSASGVSVSSTAAFVPPTSRQPSFDSPPYSSFVCLISLPQPSFVFSSFLNLVNTSLRLFETSVRHLQSHWRHLHSRI